MGALEQLEPNKQNIVFESFKEIFKKKIQHTPTITFDHIAQDIGDFYGFDWQHYPWPYARHWFQQITSLTFASDLLKEKGLYEVIFHNHEYITLWGESPRQFQNDGLSEDDFNLALEVLALKNYQDFNYQNPFVSFKLEVSDFKLRATLIHKELTPEKKSHQLILRLPPAKEILLKNFYQNNEQKVFIEKLIKEKKNLVICGATGSGKTTFIRNLLPLIPKQEHVIILEDTHEIIPPSPYWGHLLAKDEDGKRLVDFCHYTLRMSPERLILGEIRSHEVVPFLLMANSGHRGIMTTCHADSPRDALNRLALLFQIYSQTEGLQYENIMKILCQGVDFVIFLDKRKVRTISQVLGQENGHPYLEEFNF